MMFSIVPCVGHKLTLVPFCVMLSLLVFVLNVSIREFSIFLPEVSRCPAR